MPSPRTELKEDREMVTHYSYRLDEFMRIPRGLAIVWRAQTDDPDLFSTRLLRVSFNWPPIEVLYFISKYPRKPDDDFWLIVAQTLSGRIAQLADMLSRGAQAVSQDWIKGWEFEAEIMGNLESLEEEYLEIQSAFSVVRAPRHPKLKQAKSYLDAFFKYCKLAFHWGKHHHRDASAGPGERALYETGMARTAAINRLTFNGTQFRDNAFLAAQSAAEALAIIEREAGPVANATNEGTEDRVRRARRPRRRRPPRRAI